MSATPAKTLAALRQLACLGLPGKTVLPEAIELLRALVGFERGGAYYLDHSCRVVDAYIPEGMPADVMLDYFENFHNRPEGDGLTGPSLEVAQSSGAKLIHSSSHIGRAALAATEFYNRIMRPMGYGWTCQLPLRDGDRPLAALLLGRPFSRKDFSAADLRLLEQAQPWLCHALARDGLAPADDAGYALPTGESGMAIIDGEGRLLVASPGAIALLHMAAGVAMVPANLRGAVRSDVQTLLKRLARAVGAGLAGKGEILPAGLIRNEHGSFRLRAYALEDCAAVAPMRASLHIERHAPLSLRLFRSARFLALSARERDVCLGMLSGRSHTEIACGMGVKPSSVIHHAKELYLRLGIANRKELLPALLSMAMH